MNEEAAPYGPGPAQVRRGERTASDRAWLRSQELQRLEVAYLIASGTRVENSTVTEAARTVLVEALKLWEREHLPEPLDKLLLDRAMGRP